MWRLAVSQENIIFKLDNCFCLQKTGRKLQMEEIVSEEDLWERIIAFQGVSFKTYSGLDFTYTLKKGRNGIYTKELWIDRRKNSKSLAWSSVRMAYRNIKEKGTMVDRPKALGDIRGVTYIYGIFYRFKLIDVPEPVKEKMQEGISDGMNDKQ